MSTRAQRREITERAILDAARGLLIEGGQEALTVRGLARKLNLVPSALYRYVSSREELLTILFSHIYADWAEYVETAHDAVPRDDLRGRWRAFAHALRDWAREHPYEWTLINGTPLRDYQVPPTETLNHGIRLHLLLARLGQDAEASGMYPRVRPEGSPTAMPGLRPFLLSQGVDISEESVLAGVAGWHLLMGALYEEIFGLFGAELEDQDVYYEAMVLATEKLLFG